MAFGGSASPLHALPNGRGASLSSNPSTAASDEWTAGFVFQSSPARAPKRRGRDPKRNQARKSQTALLATKLHGGESPPASGPATALGAAASAWGALGVLYILLNPVKRLLPIALLPLKGGAAALGPAGWCAYAGFVCFMAFFEGYKGFQCKFSPMVVARAATLEIGPSAGGPGWWIKALLAPVYSMGLFHATRKRLATSWGMLIGISAIVAICKRVPQPWRSVIDGGVVVGLTWGSLSVGAIYLSSKLRGNPPPLDPQLP
eukprot:CAMPEP_0172634426 /NCGR_PEP_ID=MMETSP1068-20121228/194489_1 /TAXON_ID=35684 /ORGANISM="Pseudopedinella elastica, Strain CCMP716" /LENGTH=260 /DNA_ID=CAMNT_0013446381 /DNA_START=106 /DNA_END=891 /DNA_ORIENTATION=+